MRDRGLRPRVHWQDWYDPVSRIWLPFGLFPHWAWYQDVRCWRDVTLDQVLPWRRRRAERVLDEYWARQLAAILAELREDGPLPPSP